MKSISDALEVVSNIRDYKLENIRREVTLFDRSRELEINFCHALNLSLDSYRIGDIGRYRLSLITSAHESLANKINEFVTFAARESSGCSNYDADSNEWIFKHAPLFSLRHNSSTEFKSLIERTSTLDDSDFEKAMAFLADFDFSALLQPILNTYTSDIAVTTVRRIAALKIVRFFGLNRHDLSDISKAKKGGYQLTLNVYSRPNEYTWTSPKSREWGRAAGDLFELQKALEDAREWADDFAFHDLSRVFGQLRGGSHHDVYYDSREKFQSGSCQITMFNQKIEILVPSSLLSQLIGFVRVYASDELYQNSKAA